MTLWNATRIACSYWKVLIIFNRFPLSSWASLLPFIFATAIWAGFSVVPLFCTKLKEEAEFYSPFKLSNVRWKNFQRWVWHWGSRKNQWQCWVPSSWFILLLHVWTGTSSGLGKIIDESNSRTFICIVAFRSWIIFFMGLGRFGWTRRNWNRRENLAHFWIMFDIVIFGCLSVFAPSCVTPSSRWKTLLAPLSHRIWDVLSLTPWNFWAPATLNSDICAFIESLSKASD